MSPTLLYGTELFTLTPSLLTKLERCQHWFLKNIFYVPKFAPRLLLLLLSGLNSVESEINIRKLLFLVRLLTRENMAPVVRNLFQIRSQSFLILTLSPWECCPVYVRLYTNMKFSISSNPGSLVLFFHHMRNGKRL